MRIGFKTRQPRWIGVLVVLGILGGIATASATSGLHITAGDVQMSMDVTAERGLHIEFGKALKG